MKRTLLVSGIIFSIFMSVQAQTVKIGYTNMELVLVYMPEYKQMEQVLQTYQTKLGNQLIVKEDYAKNKLQEYYKKKESGQYSQEQLKAMENEIIKLQDEISKSSRDAENKLLQKQQELLVPITTKLHNAIKKVAKENGFTYILNQTDGSGVSTVLFGPEEHSITELLMKELGIRIPQN